MSTPQVPQPPRINLPPVAAIKCSVCTNDIQVRLPRPRLANAPDVTIIAFAHEKMDKCPHCGTQYLFQVNAIDQNGMLIFLWIPVPVKDETTIVPGTQNNLSQAVATDEVAKKIKLN